MEETQYLTIQVVVHHNNGPGKGWREFMFEEQELLILILGIGLLVYASFKRSDLASIPYSGIIAVAYLSMLISWALSVLEGYYYPYLLNILEHITCMIGSLLLAIWAWFVLAKTPSQS